MTHAFFVVEHSSDPLECFPSSPSSPSSTTCWQPRGTGESTFECALRAGEKFGTELSSPSALGTTILCSARGETTEYRLLSTPITALLSQPWLPTRTEVLIFFCGNFCATERFSLFCLSSTTSLDSRFNGSSRLQVGRGARVLQSELQSLPG
jgi:hypothetical protein